MKEGWICPRCGKVNAPFAMSCDCKPSAVSNFSKELGCTNTICQNRRAVEVLDSIREAPTVDAVVVTRCKDCKHYLIADEFDGGKRHMCEVNHFSYLNSDGDMHFCSYGKPK